MKMSFIKFTQEHDNKPGYFFLQWAEQVVFVKNNY